MSTPPLPPDPSLSSPRTAGPPALREGGAPGEASTLAPLAELVAGASPAAEGRVRFFLPGPSYVRRDVREAMTEPVVAHRSPRFTELYQWVAPRLSGVFRTRGEIYVATGSSTLVMEAAVASTVDTKVLNVTCGSFSERWHAISRSLDKEADVLAFPWGEAVDPDDLSRALRRRRYQAVTVVHNETSTGVLNPLEEIARVVHRDSDALLLVDAVSSLGGAPVETDAWGLDVVLAGVHKALAAPPGLVAFNLSERAARQARAIPRRGFYTDLLRYRASHREKGGTITTPAVHVFYALARQLAHLEREEWEDGTAHLRGLEARWRRHAALRARTESWAADRGLAYASASSAPSPTVSCLRPPGEMPAGDLVRELARRGFTVGGGYGKWKGETFRIGHMGEVRLGDLDALLDACDEILAV